MSEKKRVKAADKPHDRVNPFTLPDGHHMGRCCGFDKRGDVLIVAPTYEQPMRKLSVERAALQDFVDAMNKHVHEQFVRLRDEQDALMERMQEDYGIPKGLPLLYRMGELYVDPAASTAKSEGKGEA